MTLTIHRWNEIFENADTRKRERLKYFHAPSGNDSRGYLSLVSRFPQDRAMMAFGVFQALCQLSATLGRSVRGSFKNSDGTPMDIQQLSALLRLQECHLSAALEVLTDKRVAWLLWVGDADNLPTICQSHPAFVQGQGKGKGEGQGEVSAPAPPRQIPEPDPEPKPRPVLGSGMEALKAKINALKPEWGKPAVWGYAENQNLFGGAAAQLEELTDDDWKLLKAYLNTPMAKGSNFWQPTNRGKFCESFADVWGGVQRWASKGNGPRPMDPPTKPIGFR